MDEDKRRETRDYFKGLTTQIVAMEAILRDLKSERDVALWMNRNDFSKTDLGEFTGLTHGRISQIIAVQEQVAAEVPTVQP